MSTELQTVATPQAEVESEPGDDLLCAACGNPVTHESAAIEIGGLHRHVQANPAGMVFIFGCFADAPGCDIVGEPTREDTWFAGHAWQFGVCDNCTSHLGWYFRGSEDGFFGLIVDRLQRGGAASA